MSRTSRPFRPLTSNPYLRAFRRKGPDPRLLRRYAWGIPNPAALKAIAAYSPLIEIGAGTGYWAALLAARGADILAFDRDPPQTGAWPNPFGHQVQYFDVRRGGPGMVSRCPRRTLFLCWPPVADPLASECLRRYKGDVLCYVGEEDGRTADWRFRLWVKEGWAVHEQIDIPRWSCNRDALFIYRRRPPT